MTLFEPGHMGNYGFGPWWSRPMQPIDWIFHDFALIKCHPMRMGPGMLIFLTLAWINLNDGSNFFLLPLCIIWVLRSPPRIGCKFSLVAPAGHIFGRGKIIQYTGGPRDGRTDPRWVGATVYWYSVTPAAYLGKLAGIIIET